MESHYNRKILGAVIVMCFREPAPCLTYVLQKADSLFSNFTTLLLWDTLNAIFWNCGFYYVTCKLFFFVCFFSSMCHELVLQTRSTAQ